MGLRGMLGRVGCLLGRHVGEWIWTAEGSCVMARTCPYCGKAWSKTGHRFTDWAYTALDDTTSCLMERHCLRCQLAEEETRHRSRARYLSDGKCEKQPYCTRCGKPTGPVSVSHEDGQWRYLIDVDPPSGSATAPMLGGFRRPDDACRGRMFCPRCGAAHGPVEVEHDWGGWRPDPGAQQALSASRPTQQGRKCQRCNATETTGAATVPRR